MSSFTPLPFGSTLGQYEKQAQDLSRAEPPTLSDAQAALARCYSFQSWDRLAEWVIAVSDPNSPVALFESAVEAVINGDAAGLRSLLSAHPDLVSARSTIVTAHDPPLHGATLLHYVAANGVENYRQRTPSNAVEIARILLEAGAEPDALADMYGARCTTMSMLVSSCHPAKAGVQCALVETLLDHGAKPDQIQTALVFGYPAAAEVLVKRGAPVDTLPIAAGLGRANLVTSMLPASSSDDKQAALSLAAQLGHAEIVRMLLAAGADPNRYNPAKMHSHSTPLHQAALAGHKNVVRVLLSHGARTDIKDKVWKGTALDWAHHGGRENTAALLSP